MLSINPFEGEGSILAAGVLHKVEVLGVDVLGPGAHLRNRSNRQSTIVVLKGSALNHRAIWDNVKAKLLHLVEDVLERNGCAETGGQTNKFTLSTAQRDLTLHLAFPQERDAGVGDDVAMAGTSRVHVFTCQFGIPCTSKVGVAIEFEASAGIRSHDESLVPCLE